MKQLLDDIHTLLQVFVKFLGTHPQIVTVYNFLFW